MNRSTKITNDKFSIRVCHIAEAYGFKTYGTFCTFLKRCNPCAKLYYGEGYLRASIVIRELGI